MLQINVLFKDVKNAIVGLTVTCNAEVLLGTAWIKILDKHKNEIPCRVLLDGGSQTQFITEKFAGRLALHKTMLELPFSV